MGYPGRHREPELVPSWTHQNGRWRRQHRVKWVTPTRGNHHVTGIFAYLQRKIYTEAACLKCDNNTVAHSWKKNCNYLNEKNNATFISAHVPLRDVHFSELKMKWFSHVRLLRPSEAHLGYKLTFKFIFLFCSHGVFFYVDHYNFYHIILPKYFALKLVAYKSFL